MIVPSYYKEFKCIAQKCRHSCCIGWEIDVDEAALNKYKSVGGEFGKRLNESISDGHFVMKNNRCPHLREDNLCSLICEMGEDSLCDICREHPRFYSEHDGVTEAGIGLCCEEAARIVLSHENKVFLTENGEDKYESENDFFRFRDYLFSVVQNREKPVEKRIDELMSMLSVSPDMKSMAKWAEFFEHLEILNPQWIAVLDKVKQVKSVCFKADTRWQTSYEQLVMYFLYRHLTNCADEIRAEVLFSVLGLYVCCAYTQDSDNIGDFYSVARSFSEEIEYCRENTEKIMKKLMK